MIWIYTTPQGYTLNGRIRCRLSIAGLHKKKTAHKYPHQLVLILPQIYRKLFSVINPLQNLPQLVWIYASGFYTADPLWKALSRFNPCERTLKTNEQSRITALYKGNRKRAYRYDGIQISYKSKRKKILACSIGCCMDAVWISLYLTRWSLHSSTE